MLLMNRRDKLTVTIPANKESNNKKKEQKQQEEGNNQQLAYNSEQPTKKT